MIPALLYRSVLPEIHFRVNSVIGPSTIRSTSSFKLSPVPGYLSLSTLNTVPRPLIGANLTPFPNRQRSSSIITETSNMPNNNRSSSSAPPSKVLKTDSNGNGSSPGIASSMAGNNCLKSNGSNGSGVGGESRVAEKPLNILITMDESIVKDQLDMEKDQVLMALGPGQKKNGNNPKSLTFWIANHSVIFKALRRKLLMIFGLERFTVYPILHEELKSKPWQETAALLVIIIDHHKYKDEDDYLVSADKVIKEFITSVGKVVIFKLDELWEAGDYRSEGESGLRGDLLKDKLITKFGKEFLNGNGLTQKRLVKFEGDCIESMIPTLTEAYFVSRNRGNPIDEKLINEINGNESLPVYLQIGKPADNEELDVHPRIPIILNVPVESIPAKSFEFDRYFNFLQSYRLGHSIIYAETTTSTMNLIEPFAGIDGMVAVASQQIEGKGRGENQWISPKGCAMFSFVLHVSLPSNLGQRLGFVQHLVSLAIVRGILKLPGYEGLDLRLKWPNDIYWGREIKVGGILVTSRLRGTNVTCFFGCGINVDNALPTRCLNQLMKSDPKTKDLKPLTIEEVIARTLNEVDFLVKEIERDGVELIKQLYLQHWLHTDQCVRMANTKKVVIKGIDDHGYLLVEDMSSGLLISVHPDGNRFDMIHNLLVNK